ncbi:MAG: histidine kinase dimerization/phosphoacceptor domain -containing protein [Ignavibacteriaceae bacterium]|nr:histidine kinase dimerization/phosphoacceptor domain -containing protein [Ignavibacteriaceae bacterium]
MLNEISILNENTKQDKKPKDMNNAYLNFITSITDSFLDITSDYKEMLHYSAAKIAEYFDCLVIICLMTEDQHNIEIIVASHSDDILRDEINNILKNVPLNINDGIIKQVINSGLPVVSTIDGQELNTIKLLPQEYNNLFRKFSFSGILSLPVFQNKKIIGSLNIFHRHSDSPFASEEQAIFQNISNLIGNIIKNSRKYNERELVLREMHHRIKNNLQVISSLLSIQSDFVKDEESHNLFINSLNRIRSMSMIHDNLNQDHNLSDVNIEKYLRDLVTYLIRSYNVNTNQVKFIINIGLNSLSAESSVTCGLITNEIISNSIKHAFPGNRTGTITLSLTKFSRKNKLVISDNGIGLPEKMDVANNNSFGLLLINTLADQLNGTLEVIRKQGTKFIINFPVNSD